MDIFVPKFSAGSIVLTDEGERGRVISIEGNTVIGVDNAESKWLYLINIGKDTVKKVSESRLKDVPEVDPVIINEMDSFLADSLLLTKHSLPEEVRIENTIKELLKIDSLIGGEVDERKQHEGSL